jgi:hypothetical protein
MLPKRKILFHSPPPQKKTEQFWRGFKIFSLKNKQLLKYIYAPTATKSFKNEEIARPVSMRARYIPVVDNDLVFFRRKKSFKIKPIFLQSYINNIGFQEKSPICFAKNWQK